MKVRYLASFAESKGPGIAIGDEREVGKDEAERLIAKGFAEPVAAKQTTRASTGGSKKAARAEKR